MRLKYCLDRLVAFVALALLLPLFALVALAIKLGSRGPVFYRQRRPGRRGVFFRIFKFRTMVDKAETIGLGAEVCRDDDRITRVLGHAGQGEERLLGRRGEPLAQCGGLRGDVVAAAGHHHVPVGRGPLSQSGCDGHPAGLHELQ